jgi:hypothetical protein
MPFLRWYRRWSFLWAVVLLWGTALLAQAPAWDVSLAAGSHAQSTLTVQNRCRGTHTMRITTENLPFFELSETQMTVPGRSSRTVPVRFNAAGMQAGRFSGVVTIICVTCSAERTCRQDRDQLPVNLTVTAPAAAPASQTSTQVRESRDPCEEQRRNCDELRRIAEEKRRAAAEAEERARQAQAAAEAAEQAAREAEERAREAEREAEPDPEGSWVESEGRRITSRDLRLRSAASQQAWRAYRNGQMTAQQLEQRWKELDSPEELEKLREQHKKDLERRQQEAQQARQQANQARQAATQAQQAAQQAQAEAARARAEWIQAESDLAACEARLRVCEEQARAEAARQEAAARAAAAAEQQRQQAEAARAASVQRQLERTRYLLRNIEQLGLIRSPGFFEVPGIYDWLPGVLQQPVSTGVEDITKLPVPSDAIRAIGGLYGLAATLLDPCTSGGLSKTVQRLMERGYDSDEAIRKTDEMCRLMRKLHRLSQAVSAR